jgi:ABC-type sugar transport system substrate-binding protein
MLRRGTGTRSVTHWKAVSALAAGVCAATVLAACSSSSSTTDAAAAGAPAAAAGASSGGACASEAAALVAKHIAARNQDWYPPAQPHAPSVAGKTYWMITLNSAVPTIATFADGFKAAAASLGANVVVFDGKGEPTVWSQGVEAAIAAHASGIVLSVVTASAIAPALAQAGAAHIPVINAESGAPYPPFVPGVVASTSQDGTTLGSWLADAALNSTHCNLHAVFPLTPDAQISNLIFASMQAETKKLCPACTVTAMDINSPDIPTQLTPDLENEIRTNPGTNMIVDTTSFLDPFTEAALKALGSKIPIANTSSIGDEAGEGTTPVVTSVVYPPSVVHGWFYMDTFLRLAAGKTNVSEVYPLALITSANRSATDPTDYASNSPFIGYQAKFAQLWGK